MESGEKERLPDLDDGRPAGQSLLHSADPAVASTAPIPELSVGGPGQGPQQRPILAAVRACPHQRVPNRRLRSDIYAALL